MTWEKIEDIKAGACNDPSRVWESAETGAWIEAEFEAEDVGILSASYRYKVSGYRAESGEETKTFGKLSEAKKWAESK